MNYTREQIEAAAGQVSPVAIRMLLDELDKQQEDQVIEVGSRWEVDGRVRVVEEVEGNYVVTSTLIDSSGLMKNARWNKSSFLSVLTKVSDPVKPQRKGLHANATSGSLWMLDGALGMRPYSGWIEVVNKYLPVEITCACDFGSNHMCYWHPKRKVWMTSNGNPIELKMGAYVCPHCHKVLMAKGKVYDMPEPGDLLHTTNCQCPSTRQALTNVQVRDGSWWVIVEYPDSSLVPGPSQVCFGDWFGNMYGYSENHGD